MNAPTWEQCKENAAPLQRGRNVKRLEKGLKLQPKAKNVEKMIKHYEKLVRPSEDPHAAARGQKDDDVLVHWLGYIRFFQDAFPSNTHEQFLLLERCTRAVIELRQYANDDRFVGICAKYADRSQDPNAVFKHLHQKKIGQERALFWIAWAYVAEKGNDFPFAEQIFKKGIRKNALPVETLKTRHMQFQRRMSRYWLNSSQQNDALDEEEAQSHAQGSRRTLGGLTRDHVQSNARSFTSSSLGRSRRVHHGHAAASGYVGDRENMQSIANTNATQDAFPIFVEDGNGEAGNGGGGYNLDQSVLEPTDRVLETEADRRKENTLEAERWNQRGGLGGGTAMGAAQALASSRPQPMGAFAVFVDEECAVQNEEQEQRRANLQDQQRQVRDERMFRERRDDGMAEKLVKDPLRYMRNPSKLEGDMANAAASQTSSHSSKTKSRTQGSPKSGERGQAGFNSKLLKDASGREQCFEEARLHQGRYRLADSGNDFNLLAQVPARMGVGNHTNASFANQSMSSQMDIDDTDDECEPNVLGRNGGRSRGGDATIPIAMDEDAGASATRDERLPEVRFNPQVMTTILNQSHISTASSTVDAAHAVGLPTAREEETINTKFAMKELSMMFSSPADTGMGNGVGQRQGANMNGSIVNLPIESDANTSYDIGAMVGQMHLDNSIMISNDGPPSDHAPSHDSSSDQVGLRPTAFGSLRAREQLPSNPTGRAPAPSGEFAIFQDNSDNTSDDAIQSNPPMQSAGFTIFNEADVHGDAEETAQKNSRQDGPSSVPKKSMGFQIFADDGCVGGRDDADAQLQRQDAPLSQQNDDETATLSLMGDFMDTLGGGEEKAKPSAQPQGGFSIFMDGEGDNPDKAREPSEAKAIPSGSVLTTTEAGEQHHAQPGASATVAYDDAHQSCIRLGQRKMRSRASIASGAAVSLGMLLSHEGVAYDLPHEVVPRAFRSKNTGKVQVCIGKNKGTILRELGRGSFGVVSLMDAGKSGDAQPIAVKAQLPKSSLPWECEVLRRLHQRLHPTSDAAPRDGFYPFPLALSFLSLADGGLLGMTPISHCGLNLLDLANVYRIKLAKPVPELIVLFYASRMLNIVRKLHWCGKVLHCDIKPDNFVLCSSDDKGTFCFGIDNGDLGLVDFGSAIDLTELSSDHPMEAKLTGHPSDKALSCVAMKLDTAWSFDADTYGILCCLHVMLFGEYMDVKQAADGTWRLASKFRRYWQTGLWNAIFSSLLQTDVHTGMAMGSRARNLQQLQQKIDDYLVTKTSQLRMDMSRQSNLLPSSRAQLGC